MGFKELADAIRTLTGREDKYTVAEMTTVLQTHTNVPLSVYNFITRNIDGSFVVPDTCTKIGVAAFAGCSELTELHIHSSVTEIGENAFFFNAGKPDAPSLVRNIYCDFDEDDIDGFPWGADENVIFHFTARNVLTKPLTLTARTEYATVALNKYGSPTVTGLQYRTKKTDPWSTYTIGTTITLKNPGDYVQFQNTQNELGVELVDYVQFSMTGEINASGNVQSMLNWGDSCTPFCYNRLFAYCSSLMSVPVLPATTLAEYCYYNMFEGCTSLTTAPELPATTLADRCYSYMFYGCDSLIESPVLPATTLANRCYDHMFYSCDSLTHANNLAATTLANDCCSNMFAYCGSLTKAPDLPATTLSWYCYDSMFENCTALETAPELPATVLVSRCYANMFNGCSKLNYIKVGFTAWSGSYETGSWLVGVAATGSFDCPEELPVKYGTNAIPITWTVIKNGVQITPDIPEEPEISEDLGVPLTLTASKTNSTVTLNANGMLNVSGIKYRTSSDAPWEVYTIGTKITLSNVGDYVQFRNVVNTLSTSSSDYVQFSMTGSIAASGSIQSMLSWREDCPERCYYMLFYNCSSLTTAPELPATTLAPYCYYWMFIGCGSLTTAPDLPATTLAAYCYYQMFYCCTSLTKAPTLPATTLAEYCYSDMFAYCSSLTTAPNLPATTLATHCYYSMFSGCTSLTQAPELPATTLADYCYYNMFQYCMALTQAPELPATTLSWYCYANMFQYCTSLTQAPELPATTLADYCYYNMFQYCSNLNSITVAFTDWGSGYTTSWVDGVSGTGTFTCPKDLPVEYGTSKIPEGWTVSAY